MSSPEDNTIQYQFSHLYQSEQWQIIVLNTVMATLSTIAVGLRLMARRVVKMPFSWDDYTIIAALILSYALCISALTAVHFGFGKHDLSNTIPGLEHLLRSLYIYLIVYVLCLPTVKLSILLFYLRIFTTPNFKRLAYVSIAFVVIWSLSAFLALVFACQPINAWWIADVNAHCMNDYDFLMAESGITILTDVWLLVMPMPLVWKLQISRQQKLALSGVFLLGGFVCVASIVRMPTLYLMFTTDTPWTAYSPEQWSVIEANVGILCACLPIMRPLVRRSRYHDSKSYQFMPWMGRQHDRPSSRTKAMWSSATTDIADSEEALSSYRHLDIPAQDPWYRHLRMIREAGEARIAAALVRPDKDQLTRWGGVELGERSSEEDSHGEDKAIQMEVSTTTMTTTFDANPGKAYKPPKEFRISFK
ncbi:MAG: hypothetical protein M1838_005772 [Thelocarpon superellum]|nr:MAG: hypothetical protein M1838_005772 [Thelocarpon superellum]